MSDASLWYGDMLDAARLQSVQPGNSNLSWWENMLQFGATRALDSHFQSKELERMLTAQQLVGYQTANGNTAAPGVNVPAGSIGISTLIFGAILIGAVVMIAGND